MAIRASFSRVIYAGMNVIVTRKATMIPTATKMPNTHTGGIGARPRKVSKSVLLARVELAAVLGRLEPSWFADNLEVER